MILFISTFPVDREGYIHKTSEKTTIRALGTLWSVVPVTRWPPCVFARSLTGSLIQSIHQGRRDGGENYLEFARFIGNMHVLFHVCLALIYSSRIRQFTPMQPYRVQWTFNTTKCDFGPWCRSFKNQIFRQYCSAMQFRMKNSGRQLFVDQLDATALVYDDLGSARSLRAKLCRIPWTVDPILITEARPDGFRYTKCRDYVPWQNYLSDIWKKYEQIIGFVSRCSHGFAQCRVILVMSAFAQGLRSRCSLPRGPAKIKQPQQTWTG